MLKKLMKSYYCKINTVENTEELIRYAFKTIVHLQMKQNVNLSSHHFHVNQIFYRSKQE